MVQTLDGRNHAIEGSNTIDKFVRSAQSSLAVGVGVEEGEQWVDLPVHDVTTAARLVRIAAAGLAAVALLALPLILLWRSNSSATSPLVFLYAAITTVTVTAICGRQSDWLTRGSLMAMTIIPAALAHLSFVFPSERKLAREAPEIVAVPYALSALLIPAGWFALDRDALLWPSFVYLILALTAGAWLILILSCYFAIRESRSDVERARARVLWYGSLILPVVPALFLSQDSSSTGETVAAYLWTAAVVIPLPIGLAISRYNLFNLTWDVRRWVGRLIYLGTAATITFGILWASAYWAGESPHPLADPPTLFLVSVVCVSAIELLRARTAGLLESVLSPRLKQLRQLRLEYERSVAGLREEDEVARIVGETLHRALEPRSGCVFLCRNGDWRPVFPFGEDPPSQVSEIPGVMELLADDRLIHLALDLEDSTEERERFRALGVEVAILIESGGTTLGLVLLGRSVRGGPYRDIDLDFASAVTSLAGVAVQNARLTLNLVGAERRATTGRVALAMAHELGKELDWMGRLVRRLSKRLDDRERLTRDISMIQEFTDGVLNGLKKFVAEATNPPVDEPGASRLDVVLAEAIRRVERQHGTGRVCESVAPNLKSVECHENLTRVVANLLDNGLHAMSGTDPVQIFATVDGDELRIDVIDTGPGISDELLEKVFRPGFSTRREQGGLGIGLAVSKEIVESLGGAIGFEPNLGGGTRAVVRVPLH